MPRDPKYDILFEPIRVGPKTMWNRFWQTTHCAGPGSERPGTQAYFRAMKAEGGWSAVFTEFCSVHPESDEYPYTSARLWDEGDVINLRLMCDMLHQHNALAGVQLWYGGMHSLCFESREVPRSASCLPSNLFPSRCAYSTEMDEDDIKAAINMYVEAAKRAEQAGFDILEVSGGDSTLPVQFLDHRYNHRTDRYGGSFENRARFYVELMTALMKEFGDRLAVTTRFEVDTLLGPDGIQAEDEGIRFVELLHREGVCHAWSVKIGDYEEWGEDAGPSRWRKTGWMLPFVRQVKSVVGKDIPVVTNGRYTSPDDMVAIINKGIGDIIGAARPSIADPFLPRKIMEGRVEDIRECIGCHICVSRFNHFGQLNCTQNATSMEEYRRGWHPEKFDKTSDPCSVLVVGGGPAGMECARVLGERGYDVHLREAEGELGGHWRWVTKLPRLQEWARVITYREIQLGKLKNVEVHLGVGEMSADDVLSYGADKVVIATGSFWRTDGLGAETHHPVPGADASLPHCVTPEQLMAGKPVGDRVVVLDGDGHFMGIAIAEMLADQGKKVTIVTNMSEIAEYGVFTMDVMNNKRMMYNKGIDHLRNHWAERIEPGKITLFYLYRHGPDLAGPRTGHVPRLPERLDTFDIECDTVVLVTARLPNDRLYRELKARRSEWAENELLGVYRCGDCHAPRQLHNAIFSAHRLAREFDSPHPQYPLPWIRERQIWGHETFPKLGDARPKVEVD